MALPSPWGNGDLCLGPWLPAASLQLSPSHSDWSLWPPNKGSRTCRASSHTPRLPARSDSRHQASAPGPTGPADPKLRRCLPDAKQLPKNIQHIEPAPRLLLHGITLCTTNKRETYREGWGAAELSEVSESVGTSPPPP